MRLNVFLQKARNISRRNADRYIIFGEVFVDGKQATLGMDVDPENNRITLRGDHVSLPKNTKRLVYLLHKPKRTMTTRFDPEGRPTVFDLPAVRTLPEGLQTVGRLDYHTEGLLILTNDGDLTLALTHPRYKIPKTYAVLLASPNPPEESIEQLRKGVVLKDGMARPTKIRVAGREKLGSSKGRWVEVVVTEGRNRLVRRMMEAVRLEVVRLVRVVIGPVGLPVDLKPGEVRAATFAQLEELDELKEKILSQKKKEKEKEKP